MFWLAEALRSCQLNLSWAPRPSSRRGRPSFVVHAPTSQPSWPRVATRMPEPNLAPKPANSRRAQVWLNIQYGPTPIDPAANARCRACTRPHFRFLRLSEAAVDRPPRRVPVFPRNSLRAAAGAGRRPAEEAGHPAGYRGCRNPYAISWTADGGRRRHGANPSRAIEGAPGAASGSDGQDRRLARAPRQRRTWNPFQRGEQRHAAYRWLATIRSQ